MQKTKIALREKGIKFELKSPDMADGRFGNDEFLEANPRAELPALIDSDVKVFDSTIILEYIEDKCGPIRHYCQAIQQSKQVFA